MIEECRIIETPNGYHTIRTKDDIINILDENGLSEISSILNDNIETLLLDAKEEVSLLDDELASYESQNEVYHDTIRDSAEMIQELIDNINVSKRLNHSELVKRLTEIYNNLWNDV